jgi:hypothetical protein
MDATLTAALITAVVTILLALIGYLITYWNNIRLSQRTEQLNRVNKQLSEFYGPLYSIVDTGNRVWKTFRTRYRPEVVSYFGDTLPPTEEELKVWRLWMSTVFMPRNLQLYELIMSKSDLIIETDIPDCLKNLCAHVAAYQTILKKWQDNDFSEHLSLIDYPRKPLTEYAIQSFKQLKSKQAKLIGEVSGRHR